MKERPILFSTPMVKAILEGRKSQTRRIIKYQPPIDTYRIVQSDHEVFMSAYPNGALRPFHYQIKNRFGHKGDILWVRETWRNYDMDSALFFGTKYAYKADYVKDADTVKWKPSIFMPKEANRIKLEITNIRVERVQNISEEDAIAEGIEYLDNQLVDGEVDRCRIYFHYSDNELILLDAKSSYQTLWESINGKDSWGKNPWVWVINFKKL